VKDIFSDAILTMLRAPASVVNGCLELDEDFLRKSGVTDFQTYSLITGAKPRRSVNLHKGKSCSNG